MRELEPSAKALVFSQFASTIEWLKVRLQEQGFGYRTISGSMTVKQRSKVPTCCTDCALLLYTHVFPPIQTTYPPTPRALQGQLQ